jgi:hypothetical protein
MADVEAQENAQSEVLVPFERTRELGAGFPIQKKRASAASSCRAPAVSFNQADRVAYVTGFAKRKRERREVCDSFAERIWLLHVAHSQCAVRMEMRTLCTITCAYRKH